MQAQMPYSIAATPSKGAGIPLHRQLFLSLRDQIFRGVFAPGTVLPNEARLGEIFQVSRITVRRALADLEDKGLLVRKQRLGTFVHPDFQPSRQIGSLQLLDTLQATALEATPSETLLARSELPPHDVAELLQMAPHDMAHHTRRLRYQDGHPVVLTEAWAPVRLLPRLKDAALRKNLIYHLLSAEGVVFDRVVQEVSAQAADPELAALLKTEAGTPLLRVTRLLHGTDAVPVQHLTAYSTPERSRLIMDISASTIGSLSAGALVFQV